MSRSISPPAGAHRRLSADPQPEHGEAHTNRGRPLRLEFPLRPGRVTLARPSHTRPGAERAGYRLVIGGGEMLHEPRSFSGTCGVVRLDRPAPEVLTARCAPGWNITSA
jgi:hypothetical protein